MSNIKKTPLEVQRVSEEQKKAITCLKNTVVAAGAGSGKTRVLSQRFAYLVTEKNIAVDRILTLTFTNKAATEMYQRIYNLLNNIAEDFRIQDIYRKRASVAIAQFHTAHIQTIDSYCANIVRLNSRLYGIQPDFIVDAEALEQYAKTQALIFVLEHKEDKAIKVLAATDSLENIADTYFSEWVLKYSCIIGNKIQDDMIFKQLDTIIQNWHEVIEFLQKSITIYYREYEVSSNKKPKDEEKHTELEEACKFIEINSTITITIIHEYYKKLIKNDLNTLPIIQPIFDFIAFVYSLSKTVKTGLNKAQSMFINSIRESYQLLSSIGNYFVNLPLLQALTPLLNEFTQIYNDFKRTQGIVTFSDIETMCLEILKTEHSVRQEEKNRFDFIMIDEFQDNNDKQRDLLFLLAEKKDYFSSTIPKPETLCPHKLFFVGDEKQSIYLFRGADVSVFRGLINDLSVKQSQDSTAFLELSTNYRSSAELIQNFNYIFGGILPTKKVQKQTPSVFIQEYQLYPNESLPLYEAQYKPLFADPAKPKTSIPPMTICLLPKNSEKNTNIEYEDEETLTDKENFAYFTAKKIKQLLSTVDETKGTNYTPKDIAILFKTYTDQHLYEKHLRQQGIPYTTKNIGSFFLDAPINDLYHLLRLIVYPLDTISFITVLCSPFVNLSFNDAQAILLAKIPEEKHDILFCKDRAFVLNEVAQEYYLQGLEVYTELVAFARDALCTELISSLWYGLGYRFQTLWNTHAQLFSEFYDYMYELARNFDKKSATLLDFVDSLSELADMSKKLDNMDIPLERDDAVQLMSIHASKGLEFPIVFLANIAAPARNADKITKLYFSETYGLSLNIKNDEIIKEGKKNFFTHLIEQEQYQKQEAELRRLLYVAMTRAEQHIYICSTYSINKKIKEFFEVQSIDPFDASKSTILSCLTQIFHNLNKNESKSIVRSEFYNSNGTLFALLLPLLIETDIRDRTDIFNFEQITPTPISILGAKYKDRKNDLSLLHTFYENAPFFQSPPITKKYIAPTLLQNPEQKFSNISFNTKKQSDFHASDWSELDNVLLTVESKQFTPADFGIIVHAYIEAGIKKESPKTYSKAIQLLTDKQYGIVIDSAKTMAQLFFNSFLGRDLKNAIEVKTEYSFKFLLSSGIIMRGQIDCLYQKPDGKIVIVDFKTDSAIAPDKHIVQLSAYYNLVKRLYNKEAYDIECFLFYLRQAQAVDISATIQTVDFENILNYNVN